MTIKRRHIRMARAAWRICFRNGNTQDFWDWVVVHIPVHRWHRAANGRKA